MQFYKSDLNLRCRNDHCGNKEVVWFIDFSSLDLKTSLFIFNPLSTNAISECVSHPVHTAIACFQDIFKFMLRLC
jgi:hypothetical protein